MKQRHGLLAAVLLFYCSFCCSETVNGITPNAINGPGFVWTMNNVLPQITGLTVDGVSYRYTSIKNPADAMIVSVQNKNSDGTGFVFRQQDNWTGLPGNTITKIVPVSNIPIQYWGDGEIHIEGQGYVRDPFVSYKYRYDTCSVDPLSNPACPGYAAAKMKFNGGDSIDPLSDQYVQNIINRRYIPTEEQTRLKETSEKSVAKGEENRKKANNTMIRPQDVAIINQLEALNNIPGLNLYSINIPGGVYKDVIGYSNKQLPDSRRGRSIGLAQESLHKAMVDLQYVK